ncbi:MAG: DNA helicase UvrD [Deltaproteobacteria bacterium]|nr:MAG: DNA helicase UvrD [Deltaproteobacteria bacterium]
MRFIADFHLHSRYSRATSREMRVEILAQWAAIKGIGLLGTGDFTHPTYFAELKSLLKPGGNGLFLLKEGEKKVHFILTAEVSNIFNQDGRLRKIHTLIFAPGFEAVEKINHQLGSRGKLGSDGRPTFGFPVKDLVKIIMDISPECFIVPAHAWTPWFSLFGANSGFDSMEECFGEQARYIQAVETGLSSDPEMNWRVSALDRIALISNSDAHSPDRIGREANVFNCGLDYQEIVGAIKKRDREKFLSTIEFFPEEGKYHYDGHRNCNVLFSPQQTRDNDGVCPVCKRKVTVGVMNRVEALADRPPDYQPPDAIPSRHLIPLAEIIAEALGQGVNTKAVDEQYRRLIQQLGPEFTILLELPREELAKDTPPRILEGIMRVRDGKVRITPGYDGVFGKIKIFEEEGKGEEKSEQMKLF